MAKKKHNKTKATVVKKEFSRTEQEHTYIVAKKMLRHFGMDPDLLNVFTKRQKQILFSYGGESPIIKAEKENTVPRQFMKEIHTEMFRRMKSYFWGNPENQLTYMDFASYGFTFYTLIRMWYESGDFAGTPQEETIRLIAESLKTEENLMVLANGVEDLLAEMYFLTRSYSQVNFRLYGYHFTWDNSHLKTQGVFRMKLRIYVTVQNCESKKFTHNNIERKAFRMILTSYGLVKPSWATIQKDKIFPDANKDEVLNIYIQSHALHRFKERMDQLTPQNRNFFMQYALSNGQHIVKNGKQTFLALMLKDDASIGYFTFFIQGEDLVISTFISIENIKTPEGKKLNEILHLSKEEMVYLGMDKLSFLYSVDFEQIPILKQALLDSGIWKSKLSIDNEKDLTQEIVIDQNKTRFVKNFFDKRKQHLVDIEEIEDE